jgi:hypothetical protein
MCGCRAMTFGCSGKMKEMILGYDARVARAGKKVREAADAMTEPRRIPSLHRGGDTLLRENVPAVLSVNNWVWPSVFGNDPPYKWFSFQGLAAQLDELLSTLPAAGASKCDIIAIVAISSALGSRDIELSYGLDSPAVPHTVEPNWHLLGYDVADKFFTSALCRFTYREPLLSELRQDWGPRLNNYHLFDVYQDAQKFRFVADEIATPHKPFLVFQIWLVHESYEFASSGEKS